MNPDVQLTSIRGTIRSGNMINLNKMVEAVWAEADEDKKRTLLRDMILSSHAKPITKSRNIQLLPTLTGPRMDKLASDYSLSGMGMKVL
jgi:hypothetical protein